MLHAIIRSNNNAIKHLGILIDCLLFRLKLVTMSKRVEMSKNDNYTTRNLLDYLCHLKYYKNFGTDLSR